MQQPGYLFNTLSTNAFFVELALWKDTWHTFVLCAIWFCSQTAYSHWLIIFLSLIRHILVWVQLSNSVEGQSVLFLRGSQKLEKDTQKPSLETQRFTALSYGYPNINLARNLGLSMIMKHSIYLTYTPLVRWIVGSRGSEVRFWPQLT